MLLVDIYYLLVWIIRPVLLQKPVSVCIFRLTLMQHSHYAVLIHSGQVLLSLHYVCILSPIQLNLYDCLHIQLNPYFVFLILSALAYPLILLRNFISDVLCLCSFIFVDIPSFALPYSITCRAKVLYKQTCMSNLTLLYVSYIHINKEI